MFYPPPKYRRMNKIKIHSIFCFLLSLIHEMTAGKWGPEYSHMELGCIRMWWNILFTTNLTLSLPVGNRKRIEGISLFFNMNEIRQTWKIQLGETVFKILFRIKTICIYDVHVFSTELKSYYSSVMLKILSVSLSLQSSIFSEYTTEKKGRWRGQTEGRALKALLYDKLLHWKAVKNFLIISNYWFITQNSQHSRFKTPLQIMYPVFLLN